MELHGIYSLLANFFACICHGANIYVICTHEYLISLIMGEKTTSLQDSLSGVNILCTLNFSGSVPFEERSG